MKFLKQFLYANKGLTLLTSLMIGLQTLVMLYLPYLIAVMINQGILVNDRKMIVAVGLKMLIVLVVETFFGLVSCYLAAELASRFGQSNRKLMVRKIQRMTVDEVGDYGVASLVTRFGADNVNVQQMIVSFFQMVLPGPLIGIVAIYMTYLLSPELALIPLATVVIFVIVLTVVLLESIPYIGNVQRRLDKMTKVFREFLLGVKIIRAFDQSTAERRRVDETFEAFADNNIKINILFAVLSPVAYTLMLVAMSAVIWIGSALVAQNYLGVGEIPAVLEYTGMSIGMLIVASLVLFQLPKSAASLRRISEIVLHEEIQLDRGAGSIDSSVINPRDGEVGEVVVRFEDVSMAYEKDGDPSIERISFDLKRGQTLAVVGATGSGKTTIVKTLMRLNDRDSGRLSVVGMEIERMSLKQLREVISYVPQRNYLFSGTIKENIAFEKYASRKKEMIAAAKVAQAYDFITQDPMGFDAPVSQGGTNFSGGQKQRLAIARAVFKPAAIYVFDDSFSALDYATDLKVRQGLKKELSTAAVLIVAQRLQSIVDADDILVMDKGRLVGRGTHQELLAENRYYQLIAKSQGLLQEEEHHEKTEK